LSRNSIIPFSLREKVRMRGCKISKLLPYCPLTPALSLRERVFLDGV